ncbi:MAG TPA: sulfite exporter TauE/SafE family protein [bacterium]|nr:sulfite exporter TauE/SafE family protein [bacterium]
MTLGPAVWVLFVLLGAVAGGYGVIVGAGGGFIIAPLLLLLLHLRPTVAAGTSLTIVFLNAVSGTIGYARQRRIDFRTGLQLSLPAAPGTFVGATLTRVVSPGIFHALFGALLVALATYLAVRPVPRRPPPAAPVAAEPRAVPQRPLNVTLMALGLGLGVISGFFGIGAGWLIVPMLVYLYGVPPHVATATSIFSLAVYSLAGVFEFAREGAVLWPVVAPTAFGAIIAAQVGAHLSRSISGSGLVRLLALLLAAIGVGLLVR